ncbi:hypothetical protein EGW08_003557 [Elysia chlorotica]|uniref:FAS1 domain-containing protein n=1 Tax=Elysia chlorotica TaxID=188477 RepID=A0A3S1HYI5_ELYCH|nr:hypothetical protein EGW08_003557 [Elysia chlorotica]
MKLTCLCLTAIVLTICQLTRAAYLDQTVLECLKTLNRNILVDLINNAGLTTVFNDPTQNFTVFAPSESAIPKDLADIGTTVDQVKGDTAMLNRLLLNHAIVGHHFTKDFVNERVFNTMGGFKVRTNHYLYNNQYYVDGSQIYQSNLECKNGVIHSVRHILYSSINNVDEIVKNRTDLSTLDTAIQVTGLGSFLQDQNPITLFAPSDDAFKELGYLVQDLIQKPDLLREILKYHVVPGSIYRGAMHTVHNLHTFEEADQAYLHGSGGIDGARFVEYDVSATNGVIHIINRVLIPDSLKDQL